VELVAAKIEVTVAETEQSYVGTIVIVEDGQILV
jgi:hypothetical protein